MKYHSGGITDEGTTNDMYFSDADAENVVIAQDPFIMDTVVLFNPDEKETWFFLPGVIFCTVGFCYCVCCCQYFEI